MNWANQQPEKAHVLRRVCYEAIVLVYHRISGLNPDPWELNVSPQHFAEHLEVLRALGMAESLEAMVQAVRTGEPKSPLLAITFDDGYTDNLWAAKPLLEHYDIPATVFIVAGMIGARRGFWWDELEFLLRAETLPDRLSLEIGNTHFEYALGVSACLAEHEARRHTAWRTWQAPPGQRQALYLALWKRLQPLLDEERRRVLDELGDWAGMEQAGRSSYRRLSQEEILSLADADLIDIGAHTMTHPVLSTLSPADQREEIMQSKRTLENLLDRSVTSFSYPYGGPQDYTQVTARIVQEGGFSSACANFAGVVTLSTDCFQIPRIYVPDVDGDGFRRLLGRWVDVVKK
jgi:peptidoglycan/xylan/chitin deacetylase (PgdA/CDA1 family)